MKHRGLKPGVFRQSNKIRCGVIENGPATAVQKKLCTQLQANGTL